MIERAAARVPTELCHAKAPANRAAVGWYSAVSRYREVFCRNPRHHSLRRPLRIYILSSAKPFTGAVPVGSFCRRRPVTAHAAPVREAPLVAAAEPSLSAGRRADAGRCSEAVTGVWDCQNDTLLQPSADPVPLYRASLPAASLGDINRIPQFQRPDGSKQSGRLFLG